MRQILLFSLLLSSRAFALDISKVETAVSGIGFKSNFSRLDKDSYYGAHKRYEFDAKFSVEVFFSKKTSRQISQVRFVSLRCQSAKMSETEFRSTVQNDYLATYKQIFDSNPPPQFSNFYSNKQEKVKIDSQPYRNVILRAGTPKCESSSGGEWHALYLNF